MSDKFPTSVYLREDTDGTINDFWWNSDGERYLQEKAIKQMDRHTKESIEEAATVRATEAERKLRQLLWLNHGCSINMLYGDDGEMQCSACMIDFKRDPVEKIEKAIINKSKTKWVYSEIADRPEGE
jgi:hypothetical protein